MNSKIPASAGYVSFKDLLKTSSVSEKGEVKEDVFQEHRAVATPVVEENSLPETSTKNSLGNFFGKSIQRVFNERSLRRISTEGNYAALGGAGLGFLIGLPLGTPLSGAYLGANIAGALGTTKSVIKSALDQTEELKGENIHPLDDEESEDDDSTTFEEVSLNDFHPEEIAPSSESTRVSPNKNRLHSKLAYADEVQGVDGAQKLSVQELLDASSPGATKQLAAEVELGKKSNNSGHFFGVTIKQVSPHAVFEEASALANYGALAGVVLGGVESATLGTSFLQSAYSASGGGWVVGAIGGVVRSLYHQTRNPEANPLK
ncbi:MAG: hypothetical protein A3F67_10750 [Verrucomicrobia bacterium RIFCSPHIGHO2_12_FULL_41_10]|nr:MAG: hypothetical protein A3F67_10750 [Verrucomicrobia bacterium RIFCSPHIGHO2_12_FULL_41_10]HLB34216.1 hypothetical protein [Chthoniobacterales bacterium]